MTSRFQVFLRKVFSASLIEPLVLVALYLGFLYFIQGALPSSEQIVVHLTSLYERYGYEILFLGAILESLVIVNLFAPGMTALAFGGVFARTGQLGLGEAITAAVAGALTGFIIDFFLGYFGFSKIVQKWGGVSAMDKIKNQIEVSRIRTFGLGFFHPNVGSAISLASGTIKMKFTTFMTLSSVSTFGWFSLWGVLVFLMGDVVLKIMTDYAYVIVAIIGSIWIMLAMYGRRKSVHS